MSTDKASILVVDDSESAVTALERMLDAWGYQNVLGTTDPARALELAHDVRPDLVVLDLHMPPPGGWKLLEELARSNGTEGTEVMIISGDASVEARERALRMGAGDFLVKPYNAEEARLRIGRLIAARGEEQRLRARSDVMERRLLERTRQLEHARLELLSRLAIAGEYRDDSTHEHAQRVGRTAAAIARELGLDAERVRVLRHAAPLHDIGKIGVPDAVLLKPGRLDESEFELMKTHTLIGNDILTGSGSDLLDMGAEIALRHHERWDGRGYPGGLAGERIPLPGRIVAVADAFDAMAHDRPYEQALGVETAVARVREAAGTQFDPAVVDAFLRLDHETLLAPIGDWDV